MDLITVFMPLTLISAFSISEPEMLERHVEDALVQHVAKAGGRAAKWVSPGHDGPAESTIERTVSKYAKDRGALAYKWISPGQAGVCDHFYIYSGRIWFVEFKKFGEKPTPLQAKHHQALARHGMAVYVVDSVDLGKKVIDHETGKDTTGFERAKVFAVDRDKSV